MAEYTGTFETGVNAANIVIGDAGSATQWDEAADPINVTLTYSNVQAYETLSCEIFCNATGGQAYVGWDTSTISPSFTGTHYGRIYWYFSSGFPSATCIPVRGFNTAGTPAWDVLMTTGGLLRLRDASSTTRATFTTPINTGAWCRFEWMVVQSTTAAVLEGKLFNSADSLTPTETRTSTGSFSVLVDTARARFGMNGVNVPNLLYYQDNIVMNDTGYPGPLFPPVASDENLAPVIYGRGAA